jgi:penicillin-binding protein 1A
MRERVADAGSAYQVVAMLQGVVQRGTARRVSELGRPLAGKTGTTNDSEDTWFVGFSPDLVAGVFVGFDQPRTLGEQETGSSAAAPIFKQFMGEALKGKPAIPFRIPPGMRMVRINAKTGAPARPGESDVVLEPFKPGTEPTAEMRQVLDGSGAFETTPAVGPSAPPPPVTNVRGLY